MKAAVARKPIIKIAVVESDPLRFVGFRALFDTEPEFELISAGLPEISTLQDVDLILLGNRSGPKFVRCDGEPEGDASGSAHYRHRIGSRRRDHSEGDRFWSQGYVDEAASPAEFAQGDSHRESGVGVGAAPSAFDFIERVSSAPGRIFPAGRVTFTDREKKCWRCWWRDAPTKRLGRSWALKSVR